MCKIFFTSPQAQDVLLPAELCQAEIYCFNKQTSLLWGQTADLQAAEERVENLFSERWACVEEESLNRKGDISEDGREKRHCWSLTEITDGPNSF